MPVVWLIPVSYTHLTFVEFFTFKFLSDISVLRGIYSFEGIYSVYAEQSSKDAFIQYLTTVRKKLLELFPYNPEDGTTIINGRIFHTETDDIGNPCLLYTSTVVQTLTVLAFRGWWKMQKQDV